MKGDNSRNIGTVRGIAGGEKFREMTFKIVGERWEKFRENLQKIRRTGIENRIDYATLDQWVNVVYKVGPPIVRVELAGD